MEGKEFARVIERELAMRGITKGEFYNALNISPTAMYGWKRGAEPKRETVDAVNKYFGIGASEEAVDDMREFLREDLRILLRSASDLPPSSVYQLIAQIEKEKENAD